MIHLERLIAEEIENDTCQSISVLFRTQRTALLLRNSRRLFFCHDVGSETYAMWDELCEMGNEYRLELEAHMEEKAVARTTKGPT